MFHASRRQLIAASLAMLGGICLPGVAMAADRPTLPVEDFYNALMDAMRHAREWKVQGRYQHLEPVMLHSFDVASMVRMAIGRDYDALPDDDRTKLHDAFGKLLVASFASEFDDFKGEKFTIDDQLTDHAGGKLVHTKFVPAGAPVDINYVVRSAGDTWRIVDVYLNGNISQLATWRAKYGSLLKKGGTPAMLQAVDQQTAKFMAAI
jgi:phospholipid transport system substrate-binding protein